MSMKDIPVRIGLVVLLWMCGAKLAFAEMPVPTEPAFESKAMTIVFEPPKGKEKEFLEVFVKSQAAYMKAYGGRAAAGVKVINLVPTELGEPLIHLMIYQDKAAYERAKKIFTSREALSGYIDGHIKTYGGYKISREYLASSKVYLSNVLTE
ncbi:hypothetical protein PS862_04526 [Pseudomonas fluorescens]|uniref:Uncharacterized protein n=1 Tax=Pseudomonas fluorescens TaxID=294 RepID=A0A5E7NB18_PSEFL|nr:hypothetical protein [Pseudomonas fluorescens]VVP34079.1 hypothetical protein PS862_04526 [Pseudomonas fluorescens]